MVGDGRCSVREQLLTFSVACNTTMDGEKHTFVLSWGLPQDDGRTPPDGCQAATVYQSSVIEGGATFEDQLDGTLHC